MLNQDSLRIGVVIPVLNNLRYLRNLLPTVRSQQHKITYFIIDNGSNAETATFVDQLPAPGFITEHYDEPLGVSNAWNRGIELCLSHEMDLAYVVNTDVALHPTAIDNLVPVVVDKGLMLATSVNVGQIPGYVGFQGTFGRLARFTDQEIQALTTMLLHVDAPPPTALNLTHVDPSAFLVDPLRLVECVGWFDPDFHPAYFEDTDMVWRIVAGGFDVGSCFGSLMLHFHGRGVVEGGFNNSSYFENQKRFLLKHSTTTEDLAEAYRRRDGVVPG